MKRRNFLHSVTYGSLGAGLLPVYPDRFFSGEMLAGHGGQKIKRFGDGRDWFKDARFGMFIYYGLYSQLGRGEWVQLRDTIPLDEYARLKDSFTASGFDADFIVGMPKKADMKYIPITTIHHDGERREK